MAWWCNSCSALHSDVDPACPIGERVKAQNAELLAELKRLKEKCVVGGMPSPGLICIPERDWNRSQGAIVELTRQVVDATSILRELVEVGDPHENANCPQDDTCECKLAEKINTFLAGHPRPPEKTGQDAAQGKTFGAGEPCPRCTYQMPVGGPCTKCGYVVKAKSESRYGWSEDPETDRALQAKYGDSIHRPKPAMPTTCIWCNRKPVTPPFTICSDCLDATRPPDGSACTGMGDPKPASTELTGPRDEVLNELTQEAQKLGMYDVPAGGKCQANVPTQGGDTRRCWNPLPCAAHPCPHPNPTGFVGPCRACGDE